MMMNKLRNALAGALAVAGLALGLVPVATAEQSPASIPEVTVYKSPSCGCCGAWVDYLQDNGLRVTAHDVTDLSGIRAKLGMTDPRLMSCHTAVVDGYLVEGHVPVSDIRRMLAERPPIRGITAPGMPSLSPGMNSIEPKGYDVLSFDAEGRVEVFSRY